MSNPKVYKNFINGKWIESSSGKTYENLNPANTDEVVGIFQKSNADDVNKAIEAAAEAYKKWRLVPAPKRGEILYKIAQRLLAGKEQFSQDMTREMGKVIKETRGDTQEAIDMTFYMAGEGRRLFGMTTPSEMDSKFCMTVRQPLGVCSFITPWNFPMAIPSWKMMPALICGNTIVIKPATETPLSVVNLIKVCEEEGIPAGVVNMVTGSGAALGDPLIKNPHVKVVSFTGSTEIGRHISEACAPEFKHCSLEMGGKNVQIVMDDADLELAVDGALWGAFGTTGQRCTATSRIVCHKDVVEKFTKMIVERASKLKVGNGLDTSVDMGPSINQAQQDTVLSYIEIGKKDGAKLATGGEKLTGGIYDKGFFTQPTVFTGVTQNMRIWKEEIFGPVLSIAVCNGLDNAIEMANDTTYGLSASIFTQDVNKAFRAMRDVYTGIFYVNAPTIGAETHLPFGGTKETGNGHREASEAALDVFSEWKSVYVDYSGTLQRAQIDNQ
ncbi:MAG TPA: aldehyde dehydrogenase family protein [candidate division Zixibacteria bacterium]|nr:aldehyde dehydrogenase family protein [candidate division Zixibacteria bacterium]